MARKPHEGPRVVATNKKARHDFLIEEELEVGIVLVGTEVKSLRENRVSIREAYGIIKRNELWLVGATIAEYSHGNINNHVQTRERKLLAHAREIRAWTKKVREKGTTIVPLEIYFKEHLVKVRIALVRGKKLYDKREDQKQRSAKREIDRALTRRR